MPGRVFLCAIDLVHKFLRAGFQERVQVALSVFNSPATILTNVGPRFSSRHMASLFTETSKYLDASGARRNS
jgi:hypothetical protein